jgi:hypothetical protein
MPLFKKTDATLSPAAAAIAKYSAARDKLEAKHAELTGELHHLEISLPTAQLADLVNDTMECRPTLQRIAAIRDELAALSSARKPCETALLSALKAKDREDAIGLRQQAAALQVDLDAHLAKRLELHKALADFSGCDFVETNEGNMNWQVAAAAEYYGGPAVVRISHARQMHARIQGLLGQASQLEQRAVTLPGLGEPSNVIAMAS